MYIKLNELPFFTKFTAITIHSDMQTIVVDITFNGAKDILWILQYKNNSVSFLPHARAVFPCHIPCHIISVFPLCGSSSCG